MPAKPKLTQSQVDYIWDLWKRTEMNQAQIARLMKVSPTLIAKVLDGKYTPLPNKEGFFSVPSIQEGRESLLLAIRHHHSLSTIETLIDDLLCAVAKECAGSR